MTTNVDFTNFAQVGVEEGFEVLSYAPMCEMERSFGFGATEAAFFPHLIEQGGGLRTSGVWNWYRAGGESEPWASFKIRCHKGP
jgi:hypothetical protein